VVTQPASQARPASRERLDRRILSGEPRAVRYLVLAVAAGLLGAASAVGQAAALSHALAEVFVRQRLLGELGWTLAALPALALLRGAALVTSEVLAQRAASRVKAAQRSRLGKRLWELGPLAMRGERAGEVATTLGEGVEALDGYLGQALPQLALAVLVPALILGVYLAVDPLSALALLVVAPFIPLLTILIGLKTRDLMDRRWAQLARMGAHFLDMLQGLPTLKLFGQSLAQAAGIEQVSERYGRSTMDVLRVAFQSSLVLDLAATMGVALVAVEIGSRLLFRSLSFELAVFVLLLAPEFFLPLRLLASARHSLLAGRSAARRIFELVDAPAPAAEPASAAAAPAPRFQIELDEVSYTPPTRDHATLHDLSVRVPARRTTALLGASGSGKSTLAALLLRFASPQRGRILVDGRPLESLDAARWRQLIAWVPQLPHLFHGTIAENIRLGRPEASQEEIEEAARAAGADAFVRSLPLGYDSPVGEGGTLLSGGQRQRVALARAFLLDRPVVVMDEPTVHLDPHTAGQVRRAILAHCRGRTALVITHDPELAAMADCVVVLREGRLLPAGAPP
jgi:ATP-binding cassette, subfamily C, bacterial CydD